MGKDFHRQKPVSSFGNCDQVYEYSEYPAFQIFVSTGKVKMSLRKKKTHRLACLDSNHLHYLSHNQTFHFL